MKITELFDHALELSQPSRESEDDLSPYERMAMRIEFSEAIGMWLSVDELGLLTELGNQLPKADQEAFFLACLQDLESIAKSIWREDVIPGAEAFYGLANPLTVLTKLRPELWQQLHDELVIDEMVWPTHDDADFPHANLLAALDAQ